MKPISIQLYTVRDAMAEDFAGTLKQIAEIGYTGVEPAGLHDNTPADVRKMLDDLGLVASSSHAAVPTPENVNEVVDTAKTLGYDIVVSGKGPDDFKTLAGAKATAEAFQTGAELLKPHGLTMCYHNHWWEFDKIDGRLAYDILFELAPDVSSQLDIYWAHNFGAVDVPSVLAQHKANVPLLHIKDGPLTQGEPMTAAGGGKVDIPAVVAAADEDVLQWLIVELDSCATDMMQAVADSYTFLTGEGLASGNK